MRGRKPKPAALRLAEGNVGHRRIPDEAPIRRGVPVCPKHLWGPARAEWFRAIKLLDAAGVMTHGDRAILAAYCVMWGRWVEAEKQLKKPGDHVRVTEKGAEVQSPWIGIANRAAELMQRFAVELGLTPAARSRVGGGDSAGDAMADLNALLEGDK